MLPRPLSRLCFWIGGLALATAPFLPDLAERGRRQPWIVSWEGEDYLVPVLFMIATAFSGGWNAAREHGGVCGGVVAWTLLGSFGLPFWTRVSFRSGTTPLMLVWMLVPLLALLGTLGRLLATKDVEKTAAWARAGSGLLLIGQAVPFVIEADPAATFGAGLAVGGTALILGEIAEGWHARPRGLDSRPPAG